ncbi:hypothetical protein [Streptomyces sp. 840.1]|uniref:hypothetical protein n=1 Tax=Streptomyces sp. 840.1 TaxID=2485152 RepID=UPI002889DADB|nr:hypothetical protein [Streptomyces sp. 840.1]
MGPGPHGYSRISAAPGPERTAAWLVGALEVDELALGPRARGAGLAAALLDSVTAPAVDGRCRLITSARAGPALRLYPGWAGSRRSFHRRTPNPWPSSGFDMWWTGRR